MADPENRSRVNAWRAKSHQKLRLEVIAAYGGRCMCPGGCAETHPDFLAVDHVRGGGHQHRQTKSTRQILQAIKAAGFSPEYRILCHNCNMAMGSGQGRTGRCPHEDDMVEIAAVVAA